MSISALAMMMTGFQIPQFTAPGADATEPDASESFAPPEDTFVPSGQDQGPCACGDNGTTGEGMENFVKEFMQLLTELMQGFGGSPTPSESPSSSNGCPCQCQPSAAPSSCSDNGTPQTFDPLPLVHDTSDAGVQGLLQAARSRVEGSKADSFLKNPWGDANSPKDPQELMVLGIMQQNNNLVYNTDTQTFNLVYGNGNQVPVASLDQVMQQAPSDIEPSGGLAQFAPGANYLSQQVAQTAG